MDKPAEVMRAYYIEYPDLDMAVIIQHRSDSDEPLIYTGTAENRDHWLSDLSKHSVEVFAYTSAWYEVEGVERKLRHWRRLEAEPVA